MALDPVILEIKAETSRINKQLDQLDGKLNKTRTDAAGLGNETTKSMNRAEGATGRLNKRIDQTGKEAKQSQKEIKNLDGAFTTLGKKIAAAFAVGQIARFSLEAAKLAERARGVERAFNELDSINLDGLREATGNTVSDLELMQNAVQADKLGVPIERLGELFSFAAIRAQETGQSVDFLTQSIVTGLGRKSPLILDNLGISTVQLKEALGGVSLEAATVEQLTNALADTLAGDLDPALLSGLSATDKLNTMWENTTLLIGENLLPIFDETVGILEVIAKSLGIVGDASSDAFSIEDVKAFNETLKTTTDVSNQFAIVTAQQAGIAATQLEKMAGEALVVSNQFLLTSENAEQIQKFLDTFDGNFLPILGEGSAQFIDFLDRLRTRLAQLRSDAEEQTVGILARLKEEIKAVDTALDNASTQGEINRLVEKRIGLETRVNAILNQRQNILEFEEDNLDPEIAIPTFPENPFAALSDEQKKALEKSEQDWQEYYDNLLMMKAEQTAKDDADRAYFLQQEMMVLQTRIAATADFFGALAALQAASGKNAKELATFQAFLNFYLAISDALAQPLDPISKAIYVAAITTQAAAQIAAIQAQEPPSFFKGTPFFTDSPSKGRKKDDGLARLHYGEAVIPAEANKRAKGLSKALIDGKENDWIYTNHILPALVADRHERKLQQESSFAQNIARSMTLNMSDQRMYRELKKSRIIQEQVLDQISKDQRKNPFRA
jgi:hypothetical protein